MASTVQTPALDESKLNDFMGRAVQDMGAAMHASLVIVGDKLGLYKAMAGAGPMTSAQVAAKAKTDERYTREWLNANAASGYLTYDAATKTYTLPPEQAFALAQDDSPAFLPGAFQVIEAIMRDEPRITEAFRSAPPSVVSPFEYSALLWGVGIDRLVWHVLPTLRVCVGGGIVIGSGLYLIWRERGAPPHAAPQQSWQ